MSAEPPSPVPPGTIVEEKSYSELAIERYLQISELQEVLELSQDDYSQVAHQCCLPKQLQGSIFVGHKATDLDSIASAIGAAELFQGIPARASEVNNETAHALRIWNFDVPAPYLEVSTEHPARMTCIVDHNQKVQCPDHLDYDKLIGVIDHHAMQGGTVSTSSPIYVNIHPWGSACTIIATMFFQARRSMSRQTAGILLSGILSDTLNLRSPTTTEYDCLAVSLLSNFAKVSDVNELARSLFKAKSMELLRCTPHQLVRGDLKTFECHCKNPTNLSLPSQLVKMAFGVIETTDVTGLINLKDKLTYELRALKAEESKDLVFLALVDIVSLNTQLILVGAREVDLATRVFNGTIDQATGLMPLQGLVSRKKDFIPPLEHYLSKKGWSMPELSTEEQNLLAHKNFGRVELECTEFGCQTVRQDVDASKVMGDDCNDPTCTGGVDNGDGNGSSNITITTSSDSTSETPVDPNAAKISRHQHRHHHPQTSSCNRLTAADVTRRILSAYKLKGPHIPTRDEMNEAIGFVLGSTKSSTGIGANGGMEVNITGPSSHSLCSTTNTLAPSGPVKRTHSQLETCNDSSTLTVPLEVPTSLDGVKRQKINSNQLSPRRSPFAAPRSPALLAQNMHITADLDRQQAEELVQELLAFTTSDNEVIRNMEETLQLPSKENFKSFIHKIVDSKDSDPSLKFLLCALTHALADDMNLSQGDEQQ